MLKSIIAAAFMTTAFTIVTVGAVSITAEQALAAKKEDKKKKKKKKKKFEKVKSDTGTTLTKICSVEDDVEWRTSSSGANIRCCSKKAGFCITCPTKREGDCKKRKYRKFTPTIFNKPGLGTRPSGTQLAPAKDKPKKTWPSPIGTMNATPMKQYKIAPLAPTDDKPKTGPTINKNRIQ
jgi:hypothetical protein